MIRNWLRRLRTNYQITLSESRPREVVSVLRDYPVRAR
jgi:hypothetical protein